MSLLGIGKANSRSLSSVWAGGLVMALGTCVISGLYLYIFSSPEEGYEGIR